MPITKNIYTATAFNDRIIHNDVVVRYARNWKDGKKATLTYLFYIIIYLKKCKTYLKLKPGIGSSSISTGHQE